jgi:hypothetical protein
MLIEAIATKVEGLDIIGTGYVGIIGLAFPRTASIAPSLGFGILWNILNALPAEQRFFGVHLGRHPGASTFTIGHFDVIHTSFQLIFLLGYHDPQLPFATTKFSHHVVEPMIDGKTYDYWKLPLSGIILESQFATTTIPLNRSKLESANGHAVAVLDTGTTLILGPSDDVRSFWTTAGGARELETGDWEVRCDAPILVGFVLDSKTIYLDPADVSWDVQMPMDGWCAAGIQANDHVNSLLNTSRTCSDIHAGHWWRLVVWRHFLESKASVR